MAFQPFTITHAHSTAYNWSLLSFQALASETVGKFFPKPLNGLNVKISRLLKCLFLIALPIGPSDEVDIAGFFFGCN